MSTGQQGGGVVPCSSAPVWAAPQKSPPDRTELGGIPRLSRVLPPPLCLTKYKPKQFCTALTNQHSSAVLPKNKYFEENVSALPMFTHGCRNGLRTELWPRSGLGCSATLPVPRDVDGAWGSPSLELFGVWFPAGGGIRARAGIIHPHKPAVTFRAWDLLLVSYWWEQEKKAEHEKRKRPTFAVMAKNVQSWVWYEGKCPG